MALPEVTVINASAIFSVQVCARKNVSRGKVEFETESLIPQGREMGWYLRDETEAVQCDSYHNRVHWVLV
jgi:hypothetical protein